MAPLNSENLITGNHADPVTLVTVLDNHPKFQDNHPKFKFHFKKGSSKNFI